MTEHVVNQTASEAEGIDKDFPLTIVPHSARKPVWSVSVVLLGFVFFTPTMLAGAEIAPSFSFPAFLLVAILGATVLGLYVSAVGGVGAHTGLTTVVMSRFAFGNVGAKLVSLLLGGTQVGWYGVTVATLAILVQRATPWDGPTAQWTLVIIGGVMMGLTAYYGYRGMEALSILAVPLLIILASWVTLRSFSVIISEGGIGTLTGTGETSLAVAVTAIVGTFASGGTQAANWTRFSRTTGEGFGAGTMAFLVGEFFMIFFGGIGALAFGNGDFVEVLLKLGLVGWALVFLVLNLWTTNDNAAYNFGVAGAELFNVNTKTPFVVGGVLIGTALALPIYNNLIGYLLWLGILIPPVGGVIIGDWLVHWRGGMPEPLTYRFPAVRWGNLAAYAAATYFAWLSTNNNWFIPPINGIVLAVLGVIVVNRLFGSKIGKPAIAAT